VTDNGLSPLENEPSTLLQFIAIPQPGLQYSPHDRDKLFESCEQRHITHIFPMPIFATILKDQRIASDICCGA
jgi:hypothetical protein